MAEPATTPVVSGIPSDAPMSSAASSALWACYGCKKRKVKCDRNLPSCSPCRRFEAVCNYPTHPEKPGPKPGSRRQGAKRRRLLQLDVSPPEPSLSYNSTRHAALSSPNITTPERGPAPTPSPSDLPSANHRTDAPIFSRIMYPSHEAQTRPQSPSTIDTPPGHQDGAVRITVPSVCEALKISESMYDMLMGFYFANMTAFSLFRPGSIEPKFAMMQHHSDAEALVAAMFSFSARHCRDPSGCPSPSYFAHIASSQLDESIERYGDMRPPFWLLQASILVTFYQLTLSVRSRSWKKLGDCIRYSYDMNLHLVDANRDPSRATDRAPVNVQRWALLEERRRAWWAVWEMDIFASTIRRLPTAIDPSMNLTMLPVPDSCWFNDIYQESCFLAEDCNLRWKHLARSGNQSAKAWFIVVNSLMRNTQRIVYPAGLAMQSLGGKGTETELSIMANCLYCTITSLPAHLTYHGESLDFRPPASPQDATNPRQEHADKYSIHLMTQLCRFMIYNHKICARAPWLAHAKNNTTTPTPTTSNINDNDSTTRQAESEWSNYMKAADEVVTAVRNSSADHHRYVNPFLVNTLWFAAAAQCACRVFGPPALDSGSTYGHYRRLAGSNLDLLKLAIGRFIDFWGGMENLKGKLDRLETGLLNLMARPAGANGGGNGNGNEVGDGSDRQRDQQQQFLRERQAAEGLNDLSTSTSAVPRVSTEPGVLAQPVGALSSSGAEALLDAPGGPTHGWATFVPDLGGFSHQFPVTGPNIYSAGPMDFSPFGLEELFMASMDSQL